MEFAFNPDQEMLRRTLADFAARELAPAYAGRDKDEDLPRALVLKLGELGLLAPMSSSATAARNWITSRSASRTRKSAELTSTRHMCCCSQGWSARSSTLAATIANAPNTSRQFAAATV